MALMEKQLSLKHIQWIIWIVLFTIHTVALLPYDPFAQSMLYSLLYISAYMIIIYGNAFFLLPALYEKGHKTLYVILVIVLLPVIAFYRFYSAFYIYNQYYAEKPTPFRWSLTTSSLITCILVYITSVLFYIALDFFKLKQKQEQLQKRHTEVELNLLKAQVQPHFLFNTLNNIYFVAQRESPATAELLEQLSHIMRYFVDEAPKDRISLQSELNFIKSYIELEKMRMRYPLTVTIEEEGVGESVMVPPMLLIPLVENVFKHGIDKLRNDNFIYLSLSTQNNRLFVTVENRLIQPSGAADKSETGLRNLKSRLVLLFGEDCTLYAGDAGTIFQAQINIPL
ncbi:MAG: Histidine kinase [Sediminibacterium sp.]|nr:Histidine kinase [Sediminibacterium sp.]